MVIINPQLPYFYLVYFIKQVSNNVPFQSPHFFALFLLLIFVTYFKIPIPYLQFNLCISIYFIFTSLFYPISIYLLTYTLNLPPTTSLSSHWPFTIVITHTPKYTLSSCVAILLGLLDLNMKALQFLKISQLPAQ